MGALNALVLVLRSACGAGPSAPRGRPAGWHARVLRLPMIGRFALGVNTARFASTLAILSDAGAPLLRGLEAARQTLGNECLRRAVLDATARIRRRFGPQRGAAAGVPAAVVPSASSGEKTRRAHAGPGGADAVVGYRAAGDGDDGLLEPIMILTMGAVVLVIVLAVMLPIMEINQMG